ncbi:MAG: hypothetical protein JETCAE03_35570 [Ignavibacteriaceae bacterium]|jgi:hypothetical protein|nr:MAG: hypothetical protein JETCAE03_35570 [Ignavibacteriaceae bacterium]
MRVPLNREKISDVAGGSFSGDMDDIPDGTIYVKTENNYTDAEKSKLSGIAAGAQVNSDITKEEIEAKLTGEISSHTHAGSGGLTQPQIMARTLGC